VRVAAGSATRPSPPAAALRLNVLLGSPLRSRRTDVVRCAHTHSFCACVKVVRVGRAAAVCVCGHSGRVKTGGSAVGRARDGTVVDGCWQWGAEMQALHERL
jgi:hypothetical protein